jgi:hypothetical protein
MFGLAQNPRHECGVRASGTVVSIPMSTSIAMPMPISTQILVPGENIGDTARPTPCDLVGGLRNRSPGLIFQLGGRRGGGKR